MRPVEPSSRSLIVNMITSRLRSIFPLSVIFSFLLIPVVAFVTRDYYLTIHDRSLTQDKLLLFVGTLSAIAASIGLFGAVAAKRVQQRRAKTVAVALLLLSLYSATESVIYLWLGFRAAFFSFLAFPGFLPNALLIILFKPAAEILGLAEAQQTLVILSLFLLFYHSIAVTSLVYIRRHTQRTRLD